MNSGADKKLPALVLLALLCQPGLPALSQTTSPGGAAQEPDVLFVLGNLEFILLHELAHLLIRDLDIPVIGSEESAADYIATTVLLRADLFDPSNVQRAQEFLFATANGLATSWEFSAASDSEIRFWGSHTLTIQRFYQMICLIYGSNPQQYQGLPERAGVPDQRAERCTDEFARADRSLMWLIENFGRDGLDPPGATVDLVYERAPSRASRRIIDALVDDGMLDRTIDRLHSTFTIPEPFSIAFRACREPQASWNPQQREITVCYALLDAYYSLGRSSRASRRRSELEP